MRTAGFTLAAAALLLCGGCVFGEAGRELDLTHDMMDGDLAHYRHLVPSDEGGEVLDHVVAFPLVLAPVIAHVEEGEADLVGPGMYHYHFEEYSALALILMNHAQTAKYDHEGRNLWWRERTAALLGLLYDSEETSTLTDEGRRHETTDSALLGLVQTRTRDDLTRMRLLWLLSFGDDID